MDEVKQPSLLGHEKRIKELERQVETALIYLTASLRTQARSREAQNIADDLELWYAEASD